MQNHYFLVIQMQCFSSCMLLHHIIIKICICVSTFFIHIYSKCLQTILLSLLYFNIYHIHLTLIQVLIMIQMLTLILLRIIAANLITMWPSVDEIYRWLYCTIIQNRPLLKHWCFGKEKLGYDFRHVSMCFM